MWKDTLLHKAFREVDLVTMKQKAREIRATCVGEGEVETIRGRIWRFAPDKELKQAVARQRIREHLEIHDDSRGAILKSLKLSVLSAIRKSEDEEKREFWFKRLLALESVDEQGCTNREYRAYRIWLMAVFKGGGAW